MIRPPSVVYVQTFVEKLIASANAVEVPAGAGSGFVWDAKGYICTNFHVIRNAQAAKVVVTGGRSFDDDITQNWSGTIRTKTSPSSRSTPSPLTPLLGSSAPLRVGQTTLALGNPFGLDHTLTVGVVSGLGREVTSPSGRPITNVIQTDAAINPGNSGGALLDSSGKLIGMNTAIYSPSGASAGIGFAIPVDTLKYQVETIIRDGKVERPALGVSYLSAASALLGVGRGVLVLDVPKGSAASRPACWVPTGATTAGSCWATTRHQWRLGGH